MPDTPDQPADAAPEATTGAERYQGLARRYRPGHFRDLIGQEAMVRTLTGAFAQGRIAQAFVLTGVRGIGKTTTARILAKGLNCEARDGPTIDPCGECPACTAIARGAHVEVIEMDAASNTGVDYIREINEAVRYRPAEARYKVYIIDEVHMLSTSSFNALLKTLEEPPAHVVFVLATTEIRKVPVTVLSRCQRFDLKRVEPETMLAHLDAIAAREGAEVEAEALGLIVRAAEGSVRDALSLLDQALTPGAATTAEAVRGMLGLADRGRLLDLFEAVMRGETATALERLGTLYADGADPAQVLKELAEITHWLSMLRVAPEAAEDPSIGPDARARGAAMAEALSMRVLTRTWQMLLKALDEVRLAPNAMMAAEMALIRLTHVADLPPPGDLVRRLAAEEAAGRPEPSSRGGPGGGAGSGPSGGPCGGPSGRTGGGARLSAVAGGRSGPALAAAPALAPAAENPAHNPALAAYPGFEDVVALLRASREIRMLEAVETHVSLTAYRPGLIEFHPTARASEDLAPRLADALRRLTGERWAVVVTDTPGAPTLAEVRRRDEAAARARAEDHPLVRAALDAFPGARIERVRPLENAPAAAQVRHAVEGDLVDDDMDDGGYTDDDPPDFPREES